MQNKLSALFSAPFQPRTTVREMKGSTSTILCLGMFATVGAAAAVSEIGKASPTWDDLPAIAFLIAMAGVFGAIGLYLQSMLAGAIGRLLGSKATNSTIREALAWGAAPLVWMTFVGIILLVLQLLTGTAVLSQIATALFAGACLWVLIATTMMFMEAQGFGLFRALATLLGSVLIAGLLFPLLFRALVLQPYNIPSSAHMPTLLIGDHIFASKYAYGYNGFSFSLDRPLLANRLFSNAPKRGDVVIFKLPRDNRTDYIKRIIGLPGDSIELRGGVVYINGKAVPQKRVEDFQLNMSGHSGPVRQYVETLPNGVSYRVLDIQPQNGFLDNVGPYKVPDQHYFVLGDNRDNSSDSRVMHSVGFIPLKNLIGRAEYVYLSVSPDGKPRGGRMMKPVE